MNPTGDEIMALPATPAVRATPAVPAVGGGPATPAVRATPAVPAMGNMGPAYVNKGYRSATPAMAAGGPVLGRTLSFTKDEFTGGRMPPKQSAPVTQDYGSKGAPAKRTGDKSEPAVKPRS